LRKHELEDSLVQPADVCPELLSHVCDVRRQMSDCRPQLGKDLERNLTRLLHEGSVLPAPNELLVTEVAATGEDHRPAGRSHGLDDLVVSLGATRLDDRRHARLERSLRPVREWEERV
jgi:hypothetical protein